MPATTYSKKINQLNFDLLECKSRTSIVRKYQRKLKDFRSSLDALQSYHDEEKGSHSTSYASDVSL